MLPHLAPRVKVGFWWICEIKCQNGLTRCLQIAKQAQNKLDSRRSELVAISWLSWQNPTAGASLLNHTRLRQVNKTSVLWIRWWGTIQGSGVVPRTHPRATQRDRLKYLIRTIVKRFHGYVINWWAHISTYPCFSWSVSPRGQFRLVFIKSEKNFNIFKQSSLTWQQKAHFRAYQRHLKWINESIHQSIFGVRVLLISELPFTKSMHRTVAHPH